MYTLSPVLFCWLLLLDGQCEVITLLVVERTDAFIVRLYVVELGPQFIVGILRELAEVELAFFIADKGFHAQAARVLEINDSARQRRVAFANDFSVHGAACGAGL